MSLNLKTSNYLKNQELKIRILPHLEKSKLDLNLIDDAPLLDIAPWKLSAPAVRLDLANFKKGTTKPETYKQFYLQLISVYPSSDIFLPRMVLKQRQESPRRLSPQNVSGKPLTCRLSDDSSVYTAELRAILLALKRVYCSKRKSFFILSDPLSSLKAIFNLKYEYPVLVQILELYMDLIKDGKDIVFVWVPGHVGTMDNSAADAAAKDSLIGDMVELIPFSDLKS